MGFAGTRARNWMAAWALLLCMATTTPLHAKTPAAPASPLSIFDHDNLVVWCIVPFDARKRGPEARSEMMARLGFSKFAYDWRAEHIPQFDEEMQTLKRWGIQLSAFWFPAALNDEAKAILDALKRNDEHPELWVSMNGGDIVCTPEEQAQRVKDHVAALRPIAEAAAAQGCKVGLYNHGGWFGEPENQLAILKALGAPNVGLVYNLHHGHGQLERFPALLAQMKPYLYCLNLNGMVKDGEALGKKILPLGTGDLDLDLLKLIVASGYSGPIGILGHTEGDAEITLRNNLEGLDWLVAQLRGEDPGPRPPLHESQADEAQGVPSLSNAFGHALSGGLLVADNAAFSNNALTLELRTRLHSAGNFNILAACNTKASTAHWEVFTEAGSGQLCVYTPGRNPDHVRTGTSICDDTWHQVTVQLASDRIGVFLDGAKVADQASVRTGQAVSSGSLALGRLVEGGLFCDGVIDDVRLRLGIHKASPPGDAPLPKDSDTIALFQFEDLAAAMRAPAAEVEDPVARAALPEFQHIPAADSAALCAALPLPPKMHRTWARSHGNDHNTRFAEISQITPENVGQIEQAWVYHSGDGPANVQCNPIVVEGVIYAPTSGQHVVAIDGTTGTELWRFKPGGQPAFRGLTYWPGDAELSPRLLFCAGNSLWALDPSTGLPIPDFGDGGKAASGEVRIAPAVFEHQVIVAGYTGNAYAFDLATGAPQWTFHTVPQSGEFGADTWSSPEEGANCWGGIALDAARGIVYLSTGSPKPNFAGNNHTGSNLFANCVIALDARSGVYRWHFQEIRHDIWDLDMPAPPILVTVQHGGRAVDAVAQVTKLGNTLVLDRASGATLFPIRLRRAPVSKLPGERTWPYQPDLQLPEPFARQVFGVGDVTERNAEAHDEVLKRVQGANFGWFEPFEENKPTVLYGFHGGAEWTGAAFDPQHGRLYVSANNIPWIVTVYQPDTIQHDPNAPPTRGQQIYAEHCAKCHGPDRFGTGMNPPLQGLSRRLDDAAVLALLKTGRGVMPPLADTVTGADTRALLDFLFRRDLPAHAEPSAPGPLRYTHNGYPKLLDPEGYPGCKPPWGTLNCIDLNSGKLLWQRPLGVYPDLADWGDNQTGAENFGGPSVASTGLVFCAGAADLQIRAFDATTGAQLWQHDLPYGGYTSPTIYSASGREFILIPATGGGKLNTPVGDTYVAFALPGATPSR